MVRIYWLLFFCHQALATGTISENRESEEKLAQKATHHHFVITSYKPNYFLPLTYNSNPQYHFKETQDIQYKPSHVEAKFQLSAKFPVINNLFGFRNHIYAAFTATSIWQLYDGIASSPIRNTDYQPEAFMIFHNDWQVWKLKNAYYGFGFLHQSNGQAEDKSRSLNSIYLKINFETENFTIISKYFWRIPVSEKESETDTHFDENPNIEDYLGRLEITSAYVFKDNTFTARLRNNLRWNDNRGSVELSWSYPFFNNTPTYEHIRIYVQYFNGYAEDLLDYTKHNHRIGIGFALNDFF